MSARLRLAALVLPLLLVAAHVTPLEAHSPEASGAITGVVTFAESGEPVPGASVALVGTERGAATDLEGAFTISDVPAGDSQLRVAFTGMVTQMLTVNVMDGETVTLNVALKADEMMEEIVVEYERPRVSRDAVGAARTVSSEASGAPSPAPTSPRMAPRSGAADLATPGFKMDSDREARPEMPRWDPRPAPGLLTAGDVDDHLNYEHFLGWLNRSLVSEQRQRLIGDLDLSDRVTVRIVDRVGAPVANAQVRVEASGGRRAGGLVTQAGTDGRLELFPTYDFGRGVREMTLSVTIPGQRGETEERVRLGRLGSDREVTIRTSGEAPGRTRQMDIAFTIDVTGSMGDELRYLTEEFRSIVSRLESRYEGVDLRFGLVAYRDHGDTFVVRDYAFTRDIQTMQGQLSDLQASGGGDYPEAMDEAFEAALDLAWRPSATRLLFLVADAPPHDANIDAMMDNVRRARASGVRVYPLAASGVAETAEVVMRTAAVLTQGRHLFLTDDSGVGRTHQEPKVECFVVTKLNDLLVRVIASEIEGRRVEPSRREVIREVGDYDAGVCESQPVAVQRPQASTRDQDELGGYIPPRD